MGLDISAYENITKQQIRPDRDDERADEYFWCRINTDFPGRADDLEDGAAYSYERSMCFAAGAYSGYGQWREELAKLAGYPKRLHLSEFKPPKEMHSQGAWDSTEGPFWELINFADNEGVIGSQVAAKLARDFAAYQTKADQHPDEWFQKKYSDWRKAFEMAARNGAVHFH